MFGVINEMTHPDDFGHLEMDVDTTMVVGSFVVYGAITKTIYARFDNDGDAMAYAITRTLSDNGYNINRPN